MTHNEPFEGKRIPFGAKVIYRPADTKDISIHKNKMEPTGSIGVFAGYEISPGYSWDGIYLVWDLSDFAEVDLSANAKVTSLKIPHKVKRVEIPEEVVFPLKDVYTHMKLSKDKQRSLGAEEKKRSYKKKTKTKL